MKPLLLLSIGLSLVPVLLSSHPLHDASSEQGLSIRGYPMFQETSPSPEAEHPPIDPAPGRGMPPMPVDEGQPRIDWVRFIASRLPDYPTQLIADHGATEPLMQALISGSPVRLIAELAWHADTDMVELILRDPSNPAWTADHGYSRYLDPQNDARGIQRSHIVRDDDERRNDPLAWLGLVFTGDEAMDQTERLFTGPDISPEELAEMITPAFVSALSEFDTISLGKMFWLTGEVARAMEQMLRQRRIMAEVNELFNKRTFTSPPTASRLEAPLNPIGKRADPLTTVESQESTAAVSNNATNPADYASEFQVYLSAFYILQANISALLYPILSPLLTNSNSTLVHQVAWSIWADITVSPTLVIGPFKNGLSSLTYLEDKYFNSTQHNLTQTLNSNGTVVLNTSRNGTASKNDTRTRVFLAVHGALEALYYDTWDKAIRATNSTGMLADLANLVTYLQPMNASIAPPGFFNVSRKDDGIMTPPAGATSMNLTSNVR